MPYAWQVRRSELDELLFRNAAEEGRAYPRRLPRPQGRVRRRRRHGRDRAGAAASADPAGRASWSTPPAATRCWRTSSAASEKNPRHNSSALYGHFQRRQAPAEGRLEGNITIFWFDHGWFWQIPLADGVDQHRRGLLAVLPEVAHQAAARVLPRHDRALPGAGRAARRRRARLRGPRHRQLLLQQPRHRAASATCCSATPMPSSTRCSPRACILAMQSAFAGAEVVETTLDRPRRGGGRAAPLRPQDAARAARVLVVHLPRHEPDDARVLHGAAEPVPGQGGADLAARRRHLRQDADLALDPRPQGALLPGLARPSRAQPARSGSGAVSTSETPRCRRREVALAGAPAALATAVLLRLGPRRDRRQADELPLPGPSIEGPVYKPATGGASGPHGEAALGAGPRRRRRALSRLSRLRPVATSSSCRFLTSPTGAAPARRQRRRARDPVRRPAG